jgi:predicted dehydrogenase
VVGSVLQKVYSTGAEDAVYSTFLYGDGSTASIEVNWSDASYRKPTNRVEILGTNGKIIADKHAYKVFLREPDECGLFDSGWNVRYVTDLARPVRFYVRGNEFTDQLDHFVLCIKDRDVENVCPCEAALATDIVISEIAGDGRRRDGADG